MRVKEYDNGATLWVCVGGVYVCESAPSQSYTPPFALS